MQTHMFWQNDIVLQLYEGEKDLKKRLRSKTPEQEEALLKKR